MKCWGSYGYTYRMHACIQIDSSSSSSSSYYSYYYDDHD